MEQDQHQVNIPMSDIRNDDSDVVKNSDIKRSTSKPIEVDISAIFGNSRISFTRDQDK